MWRSIWIGDRAMAVFDKALCVIDLIQQFGAATLIKGFHRIGCIGIKLPLREVTDDEGLLRGDLVLMYGRCMSERERCPKNQEDRGKWTRNTHSSIRRAAAQFGQYGEVKKKRPAWMGRRPWWV